MRIGHYKTLDIEHTASAEEIKKAFYKLAHKHHPDKGGDEKQFKIVNEAYQVLSHPDRRSAYDRTILVRQGFDMGGFESDYTVIRYEWTSGGRTYSYQGFKKEDDVSHSTKFWQEAMRSSERSQKEYQEALRRHQEEMDKAFEEIMRMFNGNWN